MTVSRREFITTAALGTIALAAEAQTSGTNNPQPAGSKQAAIASGGKAVIISKITGLKAMQRAYEMLRNGADTLDAALLVCRDREDDPTDDTVGYGGLPNEEGVVQLDSCCMHGPTKRAGSVGALTVTKNACMVAKAVMQHTGHVMLVGEGADKFALQMGFPRENLLTERSRKIWQLWKEYNSGQDWWGPGLSSPGWKPPEEPVVPQSLLERKQRLMEMAARLGIAPEEREYAALRVLRPPTGTIHVSALNAKGEMSGATTTSGLAFKIPGRVGDSPIIGAGCYCDQEVGSAGATGSGEENIEVAGAHTIVENMRRGMSPREAGLDALQRLTRLYHHDETKLRYIDMVYYVLRKDGEYAAVSLWSDKGDGTPKQFAVHDGRGNGRLENTVGLLKGASLTWPFEPKVAK